MEKPFISVIMPAHNCAEYIEEAVDSVRRQQVPWELWIIDDASTDRTEEIVCSFLEDDRIHYIKNDKNLGVCESRNRGIERAAGEYIAFLDADDWWMPDKLEKQREKIRQTGCVFCCTGRRLYRENGEDTGKVIKGRDRITFLQLKKTNEIACSSVVVKREALMSFRFEHEEVHEDYLMWLLILKTYGEARGIEEPLLCTRLTANGKSRKKWKTVSMTYGVYRHLGMKRFLSIWYVGSHLWRSILRYMR